MMNCYNRYCYCCDKLIKSTSIELDNSALFITIPEYDFENLEQYCLVLCQSIPEEATTETVIITDGNNCYPTLAQSGNALRADMLRTRTRYVIVYGNDTEHITFLNKLYATSYEATTTEGDDE